MKCQPTRNWHSENRRTTGLEIRFRRRAKRSCLDRACIRNPKTKTSGPTGGAEVAVTNSRFPETCLIGRLLALGRLGLLLAFLTALAALALHVGTELFLGEEAVLVLVQLGKLGLGGLGVLAGL